MGEVMAELLDKVTRVEQPFVRQRACQLIQLRTHILVIERYCRSDFKHHHVAA